MPGVRSYSMTPSTAMSTRRAARVRDHGSRLCAAASILVLLSAPGPAWAQSAPSFSNASGTLQEIGKQVQDTSLPDGQRVALIGLLGQWGNPEVRDALLPVLQDPSPAVRSAGALALGWKGNREATPALRARVEAADEVPAVRAAALTGLGKIGDDSVRSAVLAAAHDPDAGVRGAALGALTTGPLSRPDDRNQLLRQLAGDP